MALISRYQTVFTGVAGAPWYSSMHFEGGTPEGEAYGPDVVTFWTAASAIIHNTVDWAVEPTYDVIDTATGNLVDVGNWAGGSGAGLTSTEPLPWACQAVINWHTGLYVAGRELRGKTFVPGLTQGSNDFGVLPATTVTVLDNAAEGLIDNSNSALCVYSRTHLTESIVESANVPTKIAVLRSRRD